MNYQAERFWDWCVLTNGMEKVRDEGAAGVLNEITGTVHKREVGESPLHTVCGITYHVDTDHLRRTSVDRAMESLNVSKCGRCFEDGSGY